MTVSRVLLCIVCAIGAMVGLGVAAGYGGWGWVLVVLFTIAFLLAYSKVNDPGTLRLLYRRALRLEFVTRYDYLGMTDEVRHAYEHMQHSVSGDPDDETYALVPQNLWAEEEKLIERTVKLGHPAVWIELVGDDRVMITAEGRIVGFVLESPMVAVRDEA
jgi:hypothetical protein